MLSTCSLPLISFLLFVTHSHADVGAVTNSNDVAVIHIDIINERFSVTANQVKLPAVLHELGKAADFKLKTFEASTYPQQNWNFQSMPLPRLLNRLLQGYGPTPFRWTPTRLMPCAFHTPRG